MTRQEEREYKIQKVAEMVNNGYYLGEETIEHFADRWSVDLIIKFYKKFYEFKKRD